MPEWSASVESCEYQEATYTFTANMVLHNVAQEEDGCLKEKVLKRKYYCRNNKRKKQPPFPDRDTFKFTDYDCIGFDLDNTICRYKVGEILRLEYSLIAEYLVNRYGYEPHLLLPLDEDMDFLQKGLIMDIKRGNFLKCADDGRILRATHGTRPMTRKEVLDTYGEDRVWEPVLEFMRTLSDLPVPGEVPVLRSFKDYFDLPAAVACARAIDAQDLSEGQSEDYDVWPDVHVALCSLYRREHFRSGRGGFFPELKANPSKYVHEASERLRRWLRSIHEHTFTFLITGSSVDYASHIARFVLGPGWRESFDTVVCTAKKPGFFAGERPFRLLAGADDGDAVPPHQLRLDGTYSGGNWRDLVGLVKRETCVSTTPHCLYVGDHLAQDVVAPSLAGVDTVAVVDELAAEGMVGDPTTHDAGPELMSTFWGSFFATDADGGRGGGDGVLPGVGRVNTLYGSAPLRHSRIAVPSLEAVARHPIRHRYEAFGRDSSGFFPGDPVVVHF